MKLTTKTLVILAALMVSPLTAFAAGSTGQTGQYDPECDCVKNARKEKTAAPVAIKKPDAKAPVSTSAQGS